MTNNSSEPISRISVTICGQTRVLTNINRNQVLNEAYKVGSNTHFKIHVALKSGKVFDEEGGYVTGGMDFTNEIIVYDAGVVVVGEVTSQTRS